MITDDCRGIFEHVSVTPQQIELYSVRVKNDISEVDHQYRVVYLPVKHSRLHDKDRHNMDQT